MVVLSIYYTRPVVPNHGPAMGLAGHKSVSYCYGHITMAVARTDIRNLYGSNVKTKIILIKAKIISKIN